MRFAISLAFLTALLLVLGVSPASAEFTLTVPLEAPRDKGVSGIDLQYQARPADSAWTSLAGSQLPAAPEFLEELGLDPAAPHVVTPEALFRAESTLIAVPELGETRAEDWTIQAEVTAFEDGSSVAAANGSAAVTVRPAMVGPVPAIQVIVDPTKAHDGTGQPRTAARMAIRLQHAAPKARAQAQGRALDPNSEDGRLLRGLFLNGDQLTHLPARRAASKTAAPRSGALPGATRLTYSEGNRLYRVPLFTFGISIPEVFFLNLDHHGKALPPVDVDGFDVLFYAPFRVTTDADTDTVFATYVPTTGTLIAATRPAFQTMTPQDQETTRTISQTLLRDDYYERGAVAPLGQRFYFWRNTHATSNWTEFPMADQWTSTTVQLQATILSYNETPDSLPNPDHSTKIQFIQEPGPGYTIANGVVLAETPVQSWNGRIFYTVDETLTLPSLPAGDLFLRHFIPVPPSGISTQLLESLTLRYIGYQRAVDGFARVELEDDPTTSPRLVTVGGFEPTLTPADVVVLDVTNPFLPVRLTSPSVFLHNGGTKAGVEFEAPAQGGTYIVQALSAIEQPDVVVPAETLPMPPEGEELVRIYVIPEELEAGLEPLLEHRVEGSVVLNPQEAYNTFNGGQKSPVAIRDAIEEMLALATSHAAIPEVLLIGHATLDPRNHMGLMTAPQIPVFIRESVTFSSGQTIEDSTDYEYTLFSGADDIPDAKLGRWPVKTLTDLAAAVNRQIAHDALVPTLRDQDRLGLFAGDNEPGFNPSPYHVATEDFALSWTTALDRPSSTVLITLDSTQRPVWRAKVKAAMENSVGTALAIYTGHGNTDIWAGERLLDSDWVPTYATQNKWPHVATFTCLNGYFALPGATKLSLAEAWVVSPNHGAIGNVAPVGGDSYARQSVYANTFTGILFEDESTRPRSAGELMYRTQAFFAMNYPFLQETLYFFTLFSDPAADLALDEPLPPGTGLEGQWRDLE